MQELQAYCLSKITRDLIEEHFRVSPRAKGIYKVQLRMLRHILHCESLDYRLVIRRLNELNLMVVAYRHNGSNNTWLLVIDPEEAVIGSVLEYLSALIDNKTKIVLPLFQNTRVPVIAASQ